MTSWRWWLTSNRSSITLDRRSHPTATNEAPRHKNETLKPCARRQSRPFLRGRRATASSVPGHSPGVGTSPAGCPDLRSRQMDRAHTSDGGVLPSVWGTGVGTRGLRFPDCPPTLACCDNPPGPGALAPPLWPASAVAPPRLRRRLVRSEGAASEWAPPGGPRAARPTWQGLRRCSMSLPGGNGYRTHSPRTSKRTLGSICRPYRQLRASVREIPWATSATARVGGWS